MPPFSYRLSAETHNLLLLSSKLYLLYILYKSIWNIRFIYRVKTTAFLTFPDIFYLLVDFQKSRRCVSSFLELLAVVSLRSNPVKLRKYFVYRQFQSPHYTRRAMSVCPAPGTRTPHRQHPAGAVRHRNRHSCHRAGNISFSPEKTHSQLFLSLDTRLLRTQITSLRRRERIFYPIYRN